MRAALGFPRRPLFGSKIRRRGFALAGAAVALAFGLGCEPTARPDGGKGLFPEGLKAPSVRAEDHEGQVVDLEALRGKRVLVYFYPKDGTPGCTEEACTIRDQWVEFEKADIVVVGVSGDSLESHAKFAKEHKLPFSLVADTDLTWANAFGVKTLGGYTERVSFLIDREGVVAKVYPGVDPGIHSQEVLSDAASLE